MPNYYRNLKDNFIWDEGAIISNDKHYNEYRPIDNIFAKESTGHEYISAIVIESAPDGYFQRVYPVNLVTKTIYKVKEEAKELIAKNYKE